VKRLQITLFILGLTALGSQTLRHAYVKWIEPRTSVLDRFQEKVESDISNSTNLQQLVLLYQQADEKVKEFERTHPEPEQKESEYRRDEKEPYKSRTKVRQAIEEWEQKHKEILEVVFFWTAGVTFLLVGLFAVRRNSWLKMGFIILGFAEIIWWTSPSFRSIGAQPEFERLLTIKLVLSAVSLIALVVLWIRKGKADHARP